MSVSPCATNCHLVQRKTSYYDQYVEIANKVSMVVLGLIATISSPDIFAIFAVLGTAGGLIQHWNSARQCGKGSTSFCSQGFFETALGIKMPAIMNVFTNLAITFAHLAHHEETYIPILGLYVGFWAGNEIGPHLDWASKKIKSLL